MYDFIYLFTSGNLEIMTNPSVFTTSSWTILVKCCFSGTDTDTDTITGTGTDTGTGTGTDTGANP